MRLWCETWKQGLLVCYEKIQEREEETRKRMKEESERSPLITISFLNKQSPQLPDADAK